MKTQQEQQELIHALLRGHLDGFVVKDEVYLLNEARVELARLYESEATLEAIRSGSVDAFMVGDNVYTLKGAEEPYRIFVEQMGEGAVTMSSEGLVMYCNSRFAEMTGAPMEEIIGVPIRRFVDPSDLGRFEEVLSDSWRNRHKDEFTVFRRDGGRIPCLFTFNSHVLGGVECVYALVTDLSHKKKNEVLEDKVKGRTAELSQANASLQREMSERLGAEKEMLDVGIRERARMGRDLHDGVSQILTGISYMARTLEKSKTIAQADAERLRELSALVRRAIIELKGVSRSLNPLETANQSLRSVLEELARNAKMTFGIHCTAVFKGAFDVQSPEDRVHLYRIAQEAIHNAVKHGRAKTVTLSCELRTGRPALVIEDDGQGIADDDAVQEGMGIRNMKHRAHLINGQIAIEKGPSKGTVVICTLPI